ncbi:predicted protein [Lichtheimia corymbifera JMRC:FSU:9682]|uniref:Uncharacterized protein n=1 Tax=Lichtheimia corymbifera JMRC:FSU:9682 TaxID=1263082 RepID=A0A068RG49_9FUNG|nr:predicted protein [Lichtheimia corymbifera JMRC:FSU:9682]
MSTTRFSRVLWPRQGATIPLMLDLAGTHSHRHGLRSAKAVSMHRFVFSSRPHSLFVSTAATAAQVSDHVYNNSNTNRVDNNTIRKRQKGGRRRHGARDETGTTAPSISNANTSELKRRLSTLRVSTATDDDVQSIWQLYLNEYESTTLPPALQTMLYRLVGTKGSNGMMETLFKQSPPQSVEAMEWVILVHVKANRPRYAHRLLKDMYAAGQIPTSNTFRHLIKYNAKGFSKPNRRRMAEKLLNDMLNLGVTPGTSIWMELLMGQAVHGLPLTYLDPFLAAVADSKRGAHRINKVIQLLAGHGHPALLTVVERTQESIDVDTWNMAIKYSVFAGNMITAESLFNTMPHRNPTSFHTLLRGYLEHRAIDPAIRIFRSMIEQGISIEPDVYDAFIMAYTDTSNHHHNTSSASSSPPPSSTTQEEEDNIELRIETLRRLWRSMRDRDHVPDDVLSRMFEFYLRHDALADAEQLYWDLREHHDRRRFGRKTEGWVSNMIMAFAGKRQLLSAISLTYDWIGLGYAPNSKAIIKLIKACDKRNDLAAAKQLLNIMEEVSERPVSHSCYVALEKAYKKKKKS